MATEPASPVNLPALPTAQSSAAAALNLIIASLASFKAGWRTSEFWLSLFTILSPFLLTLLDKLPAQVAAIVSALTYGVYHYFRNGAKSDQSATWLDALQTLAAHVRSIPATGATLLAPVERVIAGAADTLQVKVSTVGVAQAVEEIGKLRAAAEAAGDALQAKVAPLIGVPLSPASDSGAEVSTWQRVPAPQPPSPASKEGATGAIGVVGLLAALLCFTGCEVNGTPVKARLVSLANADGKHIVRIIGGAAERDAEAEQAKLNSQIEEALK